jgi:hypothetical protein
MKKGAVNVAEVGPATCKSRTALTARNEAQVSEAGYHRCHGENTWMSVQEFEVGAGNLCMEPCLVDDEYVARAWPRYISSWVGPVAVLPSPRVPKRGTVRATRGKADHLKHRGFIR